MSSELGTLDYALLGLLADVPMNGYDLRKAFETSLSHAWAAQFSQIYPALGKLEKAGLIQVAETGSRGSKVYRATTAGVAAIRNWLQTDPVRTVRNEEALRAFFYWMLPPETARARLLADEALHRARYRHYESLLPLFPAEPELKGRWLRIMLERGLRIEAANADWLAWAAAEIERAAKP
jgi:PadR family transcriptional regulator, regulatory protein AphA